MENIKQGSAQTAASTKQAENSGAQPERTGTEDKTIDGTLPDQ